MRIRIGAALLALTLLLGGWALAEDTSAVADASQMTDVIDVVEPGMTPVTAEQLNEGSYEVAVDSSSSMFKIVGCALTVQDGRLTAELRMKSDAYEYLYPGTAEEAAAAAREALIPLREEGDGYCFTFPVTALDAGVNCAAFSRRKQAWYPRTLLFRSDSLPAEAWSAAQQVTAQSLGLADGVYDVEAVLEGGRATLDSAVLRVEGGQAFADIVFSTSKIDYIIVEGDRLLPDKGSEHAAFTFSVAAFDRRLSLIVDSTAIKPATEVAYTRLFNSSTLSPRG